ncbi:MAG: HAD family hydrolase [Candidatus Nanoarchaeia archaeon]
MGQFKRLLFDVSGTLWDDTKQVFLANYNILTRHGYKNLPETDIPITPENLKKYAKFGSCIEAFRYFGIKGTERDLYNCYMESLDEVAHINPPKLYDGIYNLLNSINGNAKKVIISAHPQHRLEEDLEKLGLYNKFSKIIGNCNYKKDTIKKFVNSKPTYYIGDSVSDIIAAREAGAIPVAVGYGYENPLVLRQHKPAHILATPYTLEEYLKMRI